MQKTNKCSRHVSRIINIADFIKEHEDVDDWYVISESTSDLMITPVKSPIAGILRFSTETLLLYANQCTAGYIYYYDPDVKDVPETSINMEYVMHHLNIEDVIKFSEHIPKLLKGSVWCWVR